MEAPPLPAGHGLRRGALRQPHPETRGETLKGKRCLISGSGTVALNVAQKLLDLGAIPIGLSDNFGYVIEEQGFTTKSLAELKRIKEERNARLGAYIMSSTTANYHPIEEGRLWETPCDYAFPCAIQNDVDADAVRLLVKNGCKGIFEGANFPAQTRPSASSSSTASRSARTRPPTAAPSRSLPEPRRVHAAVGRRAGQDREGCVWPSM